MEVTVPCTRAFRHRRRYRPSRTTVDDCAEYRDTCTMQSDGPETNRLCIRMLCALPNERRYSQGLPLAVNDRFTLQGIAQLAADRWRSTAMLQD